MKSMKRMLAMLLCVVMVAGLIPASIMNVFAVSDTIYVLAGGDYQEGNSDGTTLHVNSSENVRNILTQIYGAGYTTMDGFLFVGDYDGTDHGNATKVGNGITSLMQTVQERYSNINDANSILVQGNHDNMDSRIDATGGHMLEGYAAYVLNEDDYVNGGGTDSGIKKLAEDMDEWLSNLAAEYYDAPIFVTAHVPLHYSSRTESQGDGKYAKYLVDVLNKYGSEEHGLNIIFLHGHDHAYGCDNYLGGEAIYRAEGDTLPVSVIGGGDYTEVTLNFTYMNAGYTGYYNESDYNINSRDDSKLTMTVFAITDNEVKVERYSAASKYNLSSAGRNGYYGGIASDSLGLAHNTLVYPSPQTIELTTNSVAEDYGTIGNWVEVTAEKPADDVTGTNNGWVELVAPISGTLVDDVTTSGSSWVTLTMPSGGTTTYAYTQATSITAGQSYVIVGNSNAVALENNGTTMTPTTVKISGNAGSQTLTADKELTEWTFASASSGTIRSTGTPAYYLRYSSSRFSLNQNNSTTFTITDNGNNFRIRSGNYSFYYNGSSWTRSSSTQYVRLFVRNKAGDVTVGQTGGLYAYLKGEPTYNVTAGTSADAALAAVMEGIEIRYATAADYSDEQTYPDDGEGMTWTMEPAYGDGTIPGYYAVTIAYNGKTIGVVEVIVPSNGDVNGTYVRMDGPVRYELNANASAVQATDAVKTGITVYKYEGMSAPSTNVAGTAVKDSDVTWTLDPAFDGSVAGDYAVNISYQGKDLGTAEVIVPTQSTYYLAEGKGLHAVTMNTSAANALAHVKEAVDIYSATDASGSNKQLIDDSQVTWTWVDAYDGANVGPYTVDISKNGVSLGTVEVKVNVRYESGLTGDWTYVGDVPGSGGTTTYYYTLDTNGIDYGEEHKYIIVDDNESIVLNAQTTSDGTAESITISGNTATLNTRNYEYHMIRTTYNGTRYELITQDDGSKYLYQEANGVRYGTRSSVKFQVNHRGSGVYDIHDIDGTNWYIIYNGSWTVTETTSARVRLYKYDHSETVGGTTGGPQYVKLEGNTLYTVSVGTSRAVALNTIKEGITAYVSSSADGSNATELDDNALKYTWKNTYNGQVTGSYFVEISYNDKSLGIVEVIVEPGVENNYPEYPKEGSVKVNKTATGIDFQASGVAQVEISASGVMSKKGADVIVMLDTSSSMQSWCICGTQNCSQTGAAHQRRNVVLQESLKDLITAFKQDGDDGEPLDIRVAIADFNGFFASGTPYDRDSNDTLDDNISYDAPSTESVYTGDHVLDYSAFEHAQDLEDSYNLTYDSGTNYDYALDAVYQMGASVKAHNEANGEDRELYVIFMSDGAAMQWNYYHSNGRSTDWQYWITGDWSTSEVASHLQCTEHAYYYAADVDGDGHVNEHRMADAIKGDPSLQYEVIRKSTAGIEDIQPATSGKENMYTVPGLGATMFSIAFDPRKDQNTPPEAMEESIETIASDHTGATQYYYRVTTSDELTNAFTTIGTEVAFAANNARFVDQMGEDFNLQIGHLSYLPTGENNEANRETIVPYIEILAYDIYTRAEFEAGEFTDESQIGVRKGTSERKEIVTFNADGTAAYSNLIDVDGDGNMGITKITENADGTYTFTLDEGDNIMDANKVIYAKTFYYNASAKNVALTGVAIPNKVNSDGTTSAATTNVLPAETFYWKLGTVQSSELAMRYFVYLEGSLEGTRPGGSYPTNEYAILYYDNYLGNPCLKETISPQLGWQEANVSYAFYLVNENGEVIVNQATGATGTFANKVAVTNPVVYDTINLNNQETLKVLEVAAISDDVLPKYYTLYDSAAKYHVEPNSNSTGTWEITKGTDAASTYVTNYTAGAYSNALTENNTRYDYTHTVVWFAVVWSISAHPDAVVVDYGLPVDIDVLSNDMFGDAGKLDSVSTTIPWQTDANGNLELDAYGKKQVVAGHDETVREGFASKITCQFGTATVDTSTNKVTYELSKTNGMQMNTIDQFAYAVRYTGSNNAGYYYDAVTVIPATTIYFEESFVTFESGGANWQNVGSAVTGVKQDEDRPGEYSLSDANNIYGFDHVNEGMSQYSLGTAKRITVSNGTYGRAKFSFIGTGFDVLSMTSSDTGVIAVQVTDANGTTVEAKVVNTYYGVAYQQLTDSEGNGKVDADGNPVYGWVPVGEAAEGTPNQIWQVPVLKVDDLAYGQYNVTITATYAPALDVMKNGSYELYLDAIRIYDPAGTQYTDKNANGYIHEEIQSAYTADGERWPVYHELRNMLLTENDFGDQNVNGEDSLEGLVFIDGAASVGSDKISDYASYGPNNEVYLLPGQRVAFVLTDTTGSIDNVHVSMRSANGTKVTYTITNIAAADIANSAVQAGDYYNARTYELDTTTDMYYDMNTWKGDIVVISNTGDRYDTDGVLALTNIKITHTAAPTSSSTPLRMTRSAAALALATLNAGEPVEDTIGNTNVPEIPETEPTVPETEATEPATPETTAPAAPEQNKPETDKPAVKPDAPEQNEPAKPEQGEQGEQGEQIKPDAPEEEKPETDEPVEDEIITDGAIEEEITEQLGFWARLWKAITNAFRQLFSWLGF